MLARVKQLETCNRDMFGDIIVTCQPSQKVALAQIEPYIPPIIFEKQPTTKSNLTNNENKRRASVLVDQLLSEIYARIDVGGTCVNSGYNSATSSSRNSCYDGVCSMDEKLLREKGEYVFDLLCCVAIISGFLSISWPRVFY